MHDGAVAAGIQLLLKVFGGEDGPIELETCGLRYAGKEEPECAAVAFAKGVDGVKFAVEIGGANCKLFEGQAVQVVFRGQEVEHADKFGVNAGGVSIESKRTNWILYNFDWSNE